MLGEKSDEGRRWIGMASGGRGVKEEADSERLDIVSAIELGRGVHTYVGTVRRAAEQRAAAAEPEEIAKSRSSLIQPKAYFFGKLHGP